MAKSSNYIKGLDVDPSSVTALDTILGGVSLGGFVLVWLFSVSSPFLFVWFVLHGHYVPAALIAIFTIIAYVPWEKGPLAIGLQKFCDYYAPRYFNKTTMIFHGDKMVSKDDPQTFFAIHPHGAFCIGWALLFVHDAMQHVKFCFAPFLYMSPFFRLFSRCTGNPGSASKASMIELMKKGHHIALPPGGFEEATLSSLTQDRVFIKKRTGFIKLCLMHGIAVRPVYVFGEKDTYWNIQGNFPARLKLNRHGIPAILTWGSTFLPLVPKRSAELHIVVGETIVLPKIDKPSKEQVTEWHNKYMTALKQLFEEHKEDAYGPQAKTMKLEVW